LFALLIPDNPDPVANEVRQIAAVTYALLQSSMEFTPHCCVIGSSIASFNDDLNPEA